MPSPKTMFDELPWFLFNIGARLNELKVFYSVGGIIPPLYDALVLVRDSGCQTPEWVIDGAIRIVGDRLKQGYTIGYGPTGNELPQYRKNMEHFRRWQVVEILRKQGIKPGSLYEEASVRLKGKFGKGSEETIKKSFLRVRKDLKGPQRCLKYYSAMHEVQELTDTSMPDINNIKPSTKKGKKKNKLGAKKNKPGTKSSSGKK